MGSKVYVAGQSMSVLDGRADTLLARTGLMGAPPAGNCYSSSLDRVFCLVGDAPSYVYVVDGAGDTSLGRTRVGEFNDRAAALAIRGGGDRLMCVMARGGVKGKLYFLDAPTLETDTSFDVGYDPRGCVYARSLDRAYCVTQWERGVVTVDCAGESIVSGALLGARSSGLCYVPTEHKLYYTHTDWLGCVGVVDLLSSRTIKTLAARSPHSPCYYEAANRVYCSTSGPAGLTVYDAHADTVMRVIDLSAICDHKVAGACLHAQRHKLYFIGGLYGPPNYSVLVLDVRGDSIIKTLPVPGFRHAMCLAQDLDKLYVGAADYGQVVVDCAGDSVLSSRATDWAALAMCYVPASCKLYVACGDSLRVFDARGDTAVSAMPAPSVSGAPIRSRLLWNPTVGKLYWSCGWAQQTRGDSLYVLDAGADTVVGRMEVGRSGHVETMCLSSAGDRLYCTAGDDRLVVVDCIGDTVVRDLGVGVGPWSLAATAQPPRVYVGHAGNSAASSLEVIRDSVTGCRDGDAWRRVRSSPEAALVRRAGDLWTPRGGRGLSTVYDATGRRVIRPDAEHTGTRSLAPGVYFVRLDVPGHGFTQKVVLVK
ncbi:hypothetical protein FJY71_08075 [candidate division WOR-3 bacterium]|nr:hypothetical protein [candidate division WOR-3 bacterium]